MKKVLNRIISINLFLSLLPFFSSVVTNICVFIVCMMGENVTDIDGYSTMGIIISGVIIYFPLWFVALWIYIIFLILMLIFTVIALCTTESKKKGKVISTNLTVNIFSYIMLVWLLLYSVFHMISYVILLFLCYNIVVGLIWCVVGILYFGSFLFFLVLTIVHTGYIIFCKQTKIKNEINN